MKSEDCGKTYWFLWKSRFYQLENHEDFGRVFWVFKLEEGFFVCSVNLKRSHLWNHGAAMGHKTFQSSDPKRDREPPCREHVFFQKLGFDFQEDWMDGVMDCGRCLRATRIQKKTGYHNTVTIYVQRYSHSFEFCQMIFAQSRIG